MPCRYNASQASRIPVPDGSDKIKDVVKVVCQHRKVAKAVLAIFEVSVKLVPRTRGWGKDLGFSWIGMVYGLGGSCG